MGCDGCDDTYGAELNGSPSTTAEDVESGLTMLWGGNLHKFWAVL